MQFMSQNKLLTSILIAFTRELLQYQSWSQNHLKKVSVSYLFRVSPICSYGYACIYKEIYSVQT